MKIAFVCIENGKSPGSWIQRDMDEGWGKESHYRRGGSKWKPKIRNQFQFYLVDAL